MAAERAVPTNLAPLSRLMAWLSTAGAVVLPVCVIAAFVFPGSTRALIFDVDHLGGMIGPQVPLVFRLGAMAFALVPTAFSVWALWSLRLLFRKYAEGEVFSRDALRHLNNVAVALFASVIVGFATQAPITFALTWSLGAGHREISLGFGSDDVATLFMAGVVLAIARVMVAAQRLADENAKFV
jgi:Protein of unknown function (DUF2975)